MGILPNFRDENSKNIWNNHRPPDRDTFGGFKWPFQALSDHNLGDQRGNLEEAGNGKFH